MITEMKQQFRGQSAIDLLMLVLLFSIALLALSAFGRSDPLQFLSIRASSLQDSSALSAVLDRMVELNSSNGTLLRGRVVDLLAFQACSGCPSGQFDYCPILSQRINQTLYQFNAGQKHYLFSAISPSALLNITAFDNASSVCLERLPLARFSHNTTCGEPFTIVYASWFTWQQLGAC